jgi:hypothetical protein
VYFIHVWQWDAEQETARAQEIRRLRSRLRPAPPLHETQQETERGTQRGTQIFKGTRIPRSSPAHVAASASPAPGAPSAGASADAAEEGGGGGGGVGGQTAFKGREVRGAVGEGGGAAGSEGGVLDALGLGASHFS